MYNCVPRVSRIPTRIHSLQFKNTRPYIKKRANQKGSLMSAFYDISFIHHAVWQIFGKQCFKRLKINAKENVFTSNNLLCIFDVKFNVEQCYKSCFCCVSCRVVLSAWKGNYMKIPWVFLYCVCKMHDALQVCHLLSMIECNSIDSSSIIRNWMNDDYKKRNIVVPCTYYLLL